MARFTVTNGDVLLLLLAVTIGAWRWHAVGTEAEATKSVTGVQSELGEASEVQASIIDPQRETLNQLIKDRDELVRLCEEQRQDVLRCTEIIEKLNAYIAERRGHIIPLHNGK